ncbi:M56 family metallopeptidase [Confluentibacter citreus]|uniref:M56 family metallopeptidase n=1 Tax=Confluentibacter citreus TaxID=2007307 RepID=UPI000C282CE1|nr:M56 family metallopeptidase [Confluentibacter citreus]
MEFYILKSGICLAIFYGFYKLVLEKESFHVFKRFYLLVSAVLAFVIPLITFTEYIEVIPQEVPLFFPESSITHTVIEAEPINYMPIILWSIYGFGVLLFSFKFLKNLSGIIYRIKRNPKFKNQSFINVLLQDLVIPHTFLNYIFLNKHKFETHQIPKEVLLHEETHAKQKHSLDVLFIEILQILFWFNPIIYFFKHSIKLNHEFLADQAVLSKGAEPLKYQSLLLAFSSIASEPLLANAINYSSIKKRFTVMNTQTSKQAFWLRSLILLPLLALLIYSFSEKQIVEKPFVVQQNTLANGVTETMMKEYRDFINDFESSNRIIYPKYLRAVAIYDLMTEEQRNSVKKYPKDIVSDFSNVKPKTPTEAEFNSWKDPNKFAIWIDVTHVKNLELNNYKASDIMYFTSSFVYNNARSDKFPQPYQNHLYTQKGFETTFTNSKKDNSALDQIKKELEAENSKTPQKAISDNSQDKHEKAYLNYIDEAEKYKNRILNRPAGYYSKEQTNRDKKQFQLIENLYEEYNKLCLNDGLKPKVRIITRINEDVEMTQSNEFLNIQSSSKNLEIYNAQRTNLIGFAKNSEIGYPNNYLELSESEQKEFNILYNTMVVTYSKLSDSEKQKAYVMLPPPPDPKQYNLVNGKLVKKEYGSKNRQKDNQDIVEEYKKKYNELEVLKKTPPHYVYKTKTEQDKMKTLYFNLNGMYIKMSSNNKQLVSRPEHPILPYAELMRDGKIEYKKYSELTEEDKKLLPPPPPPPPVSGLSQNPSKELLEAKKKYWDEGNAYGAAMQVYLKEKKGNLDDLKIQYKEVMELYNTYTKLAEKENVMTTPPPPPPAKK